MDTTYFLNPTYFDGKIKTGKITVIACGSFLGMFRERKMKQPLEPLVFFKLFSSLLCYFLVLLRNMIFSVVGERIFTPLPLLSLTEIFVSSEEWQWHHCLKKAVNNTPCAR